jgi:hypothetical protein
MNIKKVVTTKYIDVDDDQEYVFEPIDDTVTLEPNNTDEKFKGEFILKYLTQDGSPMTPDEWGDESLFLVHYHRSFWIENEAVEKDDLVNLFRGETLDDDHYLNDYHVFFTSAYIHSGVRLALGKSAFAGQLPGGHYEFDVSRCGAVLVKKEEWPEEDKARETAQSLINEWNSYLCGDVYCCVVEKLDENKESYDYDVVGGFVGLEYAKQALKEEF